uniref:Early transcription factor 70 kDa subunit n=1 Tax=Marseillevirus LCMAC103 TaxID=2506604 RepID=A0A481YVH6_9VIRU|nr:MAG: A18-like helicase [Marseillevirus LCMAC103]
MSFRVPYADLDPATKKFILDKCTVRGKRDEYNPTPPVHYCFRVDAAAQEVAVPLALWPELYETPPNDDEKHAPADIAFRATLFTKDTDPRHYRDQDVVAATALALAEQHRVVFLSLCTGFGKTITAIYLASVWKLKVLVMCYFQKVNDQWRQAFERHSSATVQLLSAQTRVDPDADVYVVGVEKFQNVVRAEGADAFRGVGVVIVDEAHCSTVAIAERCLVHLRPKYLVGLTATPDRPDTLERLLDPYFGPPASYICRAQVKTFTVVKVVTPHQPELVYTTTFRGKTKLDWVTLQNSLAYNEARNRDIADIVRENPDHVILVLCNRLRQAREVFRLVDARGDSVDLFIAGAKTYDESARVLVAGIKKAGVGFDNERFTMLILPSDVRDVRQLEGRIRTDDNVIYDFVDANRTLAKHYAERKAWYSLRGATFRTERRGTAP